MMRAVLHLVSARHAGLATLSEIRLPGDRVERAARRKVTAPPPPGSCEDEDQEEVEAA